MSRSSETSEGTADEIEPGPEPPNPDVDEETIFQDRAILYRFSKELIDWAERGTGILKVLKHKENGKYRILMRQNQTYRVCANQLVPTAGDLHPTKGSNREFIWTAYDFVEGVEIREIFAIRFALPEIATAFKSAYEIGQAANKSIIDRN